MDTKPNNWYHQDLKLADELAYVPSGMKLESIQIENESQEYGAATFTVMNKKIKFRVAKLTPANWMHIALLNKPIF